MNVPASVGGRERLRLFCALRLPADAVEELSRWQSEVFSGAGGLRVLGREQLHVTLAFLGSRPAGELEAIADELRSAARAAELATFTVKGYRETRSVGMLVLDDEDGRAGALAVGLHERLERLGVYRREARAWLPHVTVLRFRRPPRLRPQLPELRPFSPSGAAVYHSLLRPTGAQYEALERVALGG